jgi:MFS family permease
MSAAPTGPIGHRRNAIFAVLSATAALTILDVSKVGVALPAIQESTGGSGSLVQFMLVGYTLAYAVLLLPAGRVGDVLPRKAVFLTGSTLFVAASVTCALAPDMTLLVVGRILQGAGAGILMPQVLGLIQRIYPAGERAAPLAGLAAVITATSLFGPVFAGLVMELVGGAESWRALFWINVAVGAVVIPFAVAVLSEPPSERRAGFDTVGVLLLAPAVVLTVAPLSAISRDTRPEWWMATTSAAGIALAAAFIAHERRRSAAGRQALVDPLLFSFRHLRVGVVISGCMHAAGTSGTLIITVALQQVAGQSALATALWMLPSALSALLGSWFASRSRGDLIRQVAWGTALSAAGLALVAIAFGTLPPAALPAVVCALLIFNSFGTAVAAPANQARTLEDVPDYRSSVAGSLIQFSQRVGSAIGMAVALILYYGLGGASGTLRPDLAIGFSALFLAAAALLALFDRRSAARRRMLPPEAPGLSPAADET